MTALSTRSHSTAKGGGPIAPIDLQDGAILLLEESHALPLVAITVAFRSGSAHDPDEKSGTLRLAGRMLRRGCEGLKATEIEDALDRLGGELSVDVSSSSIAFHGHVIGRNLDAFVDLVATILGAPTFQEDEFERLRREAIAELVESRDNDQALVQHAFRRSLFAGHPYGRSARGTTATVAAIGLLDVRAAYARHLTRANAVVGIAGDVMAAAAPDIGKRLLARLPVGARIPDGVPPPTAPRGRSLTFVDKPERTQTQILIGSLGTAPHDEDHVALGVANAILGGSFTSRLMREVRSKRGWSYGAYARLSSDRQRHAFSMWTFPAATDAAACIELEIGLLETFLEKGVTQKELSFIKRFLMRSYAFDVDTALKRLHQALDVEILGLPADYYSGYVAHVNAVTLEQANASVKARLSSEDLVISVVGTAPSLYEAVCAKIPRLGSHEVVPFDKD